ncbi:hypothetical protein [Maribacter antarcticus]|uniref:hypothetical protein n=1 Tax=Maribacter antarcticus TaxID=505250 RepID=UPI00047ABF83|nr:hypothetical protein [Maribacter antarcticus]
MEKMIHLAAQYLAAAGISFVAKKDDDSHTNLGFSIAKNCMETHALSENGDLLSLNYKNFSLNWNSENTNSVFLLDGATHSDVLNWLQETSKTVLNKSYDYEFHYDLPYEIMADFKLELVAVNRLAELLQLRILAQSALEETLKGNNLASPIRTWPHHFDSGAYARLNDHIAVGFGLAIPDTVCKEHYFYISGYKDHTAIPTAGFSSLSKGIWKNDGFTGAVLPAETVDKSAAILFFKEAIENYKKIN